MSNIEKKFSSKLGSLVGEMVDEVLQKFDIETPSESNDKENIDHFDSFFRTFRHKIEALIDEGEFDKGLAEQAFVAVAEYAGSPEGDFFKLKKLSKELDDSTDFAQRTELISTIENDLAKFLEKNTYCENPFSDHQKKIITIEKVYQVSASDKVYQEFKEGDLRPCSEINELVFSLKKAKFENYFEENVGSVNAEKLSEQTKLYGAKGANLEVIEDFLAKAKPHFYCLRDCIVPDFERIPVSVYRNWQKGNDITEELKEYFDWTKGRATAVRSSAVYSEDNEDTTGAGIYETLFIAADSSFSEFCDAVVEVFESVDSPQAIAYRQENNIVHEEMGIVLQEQIEDYSYSDKGYINSVLKGVPELLEMNLEDDMRPILKKENLLANLLVHKDNSPFYYQPDFWRQKNVFELEELSKAVLLLEKFYGKSIQVEFIFDIDYEGNEVRPETQYALLQSRFLPKSYLASQEAINFPEKEALHTGAALGVGDMTLEVLPNNQDNSGKEGVVIFNSSKMFSTKYNILKTNLPKSGCVIVLDASLKSKGHIETLCAERGLNLIFPEGVGGYDFGGSFMEMYAASNGFSQEDNKENFHGYTTLRVMLNGLEGRVYQVEKS